ncbi:sulfotransferase family 2 domain-containing protein [Rossellomorea sp. KS-H15a]|uniref:sulfotransferase family 2 domain-containing protein n=1 Tax=Rossellomorea sp. KS-H15a TaxID=2963940 RepID=UPI0020C651B7|nr:sulfotransferase family 2 domain-containing protein [Rossellomorea sp. KS-H15a]UTE75467.1 sulfotransferase family protein [Rossellomorea sp. KS-H15a]
MINNEQILKNLTKAYRPLYNERFPLILFWTPKSGCTTLNKWFFYQLGLIDLVEQQSQGDPHKYREFIYEKQTDYLNLLMKAISLPDKKKIKLVRNPYNRAVSSYLHTISQDWLIKEFSSNVNVGMSFKDYLMYLKTLGERIYELDRHIAPQYIRGEETFIESHIKLEEFNEQIKIVEKNFNLQPSPVSTLSYSPHHLSHAKVKKGNFAETIFNIDIYAKELPTTESFYNTHTIKLVNEIFNKDFHFYDYKMK